MVRIEQAQEGLFQLLDIGEKAEQKKRSATAKAGRNQIRRNMQQYRGGFAFVCHTDKTKKIFSFHPAQRAAALTETGPRSYPEDQRVKKKRKDR